METPDEITLHYTMLEYLFDNHKLAKSCFSYTWEDFLIENSEYEDEYTPDQLKTLFWTTIAPNISDYNLLTQEQKEYFENLFLDPSEEHLRNILQKNEIISGVDFKFWKSRRDFDNTVLDRSQLLSAEMIQSVREVFAKPNVCEKSFSNVHENTVINEETRINIVAQKSITTFVDTQTDILKIMYDFLPHEPEEGTSMEEILKQLHELDFGESRKSDRKKYEKSFHQVLSKFMPSDSETDNDDDERVFVSPASTPVRRNIKTSYAVHSSKSLSSIQTPDYGASSLSSFLSPKSQPQRSYISTRSATRIHSRLFKNLSNSNTSAEEQEEPLATGRSRNERMKSFEAKMKRRK